RAMRRRSRFQKEDSDSTPCQGLASQAHRPHVPMRWLLQTTTPPLLPMRLVIPRTTPPFPPRRAGALRNSYFVIPPGRQAYFNPARFTLSITSSYFVLRHWSFVIHPPDQA